MAASTEHKQIHSTCWTLLILSTHFLSNPCSASSNWISEVSEAELDLLTQSKEHVLVLFYDGLCQDLNCQNVLDQVELVAKDSMLPALKVVKISSASKVAEYGIGVLPNLVFFRNGSPNLYSGMEVEAEAVIEWIEGKPYEVIQELDDSNFEHLTQASTGATTGDWFIIFYEPDCSSSLVTLRALANRLRHRVIVGRVHISRSPQLKHRFNIVTCPTLIFFRHGNMYEYTIPKNDLESLVHFTEGWYKNVKASKVPAELSPFDHVVEYIALSLKQIIEEEKGLPSLVGGGIMSLVVLLICCCCCLSGSSREKRD